MLFSSFKWMYKLEFDKNLQIFGPKLGILAVYFGQNSQNLTQNFQYFMSMQLDLFLYMPQCT